VSHYRPPLWSSGQSSWLHIQRSRVDSRHYQIFWEVVGLEREYDRMDPLCWPCNTSYPQKLALTSPTSGVLSVDIVRSRTNGHGVLFFFLLLFLSIFPFPISLLFVLQRSTCNVKGRARNLAALRTHRQFAGCLLQTAWPSRKPDFSFLFPRSGVLSSGGSPHARMEALRAINITVFCGLSPCSLVHRYWYFGGIFCNNFQGRRTISIIFA
jgi:hypothetical protein